MHMCCKTDGDPANRTCGAQNETSPVPRCDPGYTCIAEIRRGNRKKFELLDNGALKYLGRRQIIYNSNEYCLDEIIDYDQLVVNACTCVVSVTLEDVARVVKSIVYIQNMILQATAGLFYHFTRRLQDPVGKMVVALCECLIGVEVFSLLSSLKWQLPLLATGFNGITGLRYLCWACAFSWLNCLGYYNWKQAIKRSSSVAELANWNHHLASVYGWCGGPLMTAAVIAGLLLADGNDLHGEMFRLPIMLLPPCLTLVADSAFFSYTMLFLKKRFLLGMLRRRSHANLCLFAQLTLIMMYTWGLPLILEPYENLLSSTVTVITEAIRGPLIIYVTVLRHKDLTKMNSSRPHPQSLPVETSMLCMEAMSSPEI